MAQIGETELDVGALARALWRKAWLLILLAILAGVGAWWGLGYVEPLYTADTSILIEERESPLTRPRDDVGRLAATFDESAIQSQVEVLRSRQIADMVIDRLDLDRRPEFDPATRPSALDSLLVSFGLRSHPTDDSVERRAMETYFERLSVYPLAKSRVIGVQFIAPDPKLAADVANGVAEAFVDLQQEAKRESAVAATAWLEQEIERLRARVEEAEQAVASYRANNELFDAGQAANLSEQQLGDLNAELARARAARAEAEARSELVASLLAEGGSLEAAQEVLDSQLIQRLRERQVALRSEIADLSTTLLPGHPRIRGLQEQLANFDAQLRQEAEKIEASLSTAARVAAAREQSLMASMNEAKGAVSRSNEQEIQLRALEREAAAQRDLLESFLARYREAVARTDANYLPADARIISRAIAPSEPSFPKKTMMALAAAIATLLIAAAILLLREFTSGRAFRVIGYELPAPPGRLADPAAAEPVRERLALEEEPRQQVEREPDVVTPAAVPVVAAALPPAPSDPEAEIVSPPPPPVPGFEENADRPGTAELAEILANPAVRLAVFAGAVGGEGGGDIAFAAARHAARDNIRFVLMDVGLEPSPALSGDGEPGLGDLLSGEAAFGEVIRRDEASRVHVIPIGSVEGNPPLQRLQIVIGALTHTYDKVVVVCDRLEDWPHEHVHPDLAAIVCGPETSEEMRTSVYETALDRGARSALIVRFSNEPEDRHSDETSEAA